MNRSELKSLVIKIVEFNEDIKLEFGSFNTLHEAVKKEVNQKLDEYYAIFKKECAGKSRSGNQDFKNYTEDIQNNFISKAFKSLFKNSLAENSYQKSKINCIVKRETVLKNLVETPEKIDNRSLDFFSFYACGNGWNYFKNMTKEEYANIEEAYIFHVEQKSIEIQKKEEEIRIPGASIIDKAFVDKLNSYDFTMAEFYTAKQNDYCQWYGVIQEWDIKREVYPDLISVLKDTFSVYRTYKVAAIVHGEGGSGKSILLRKSSVELSSNPNFKILWIDDFDAFLNEPSQIGTPLGWEYIKNDAQNKYLIFIEDWYSKVEILEYKVSKTFLEQSEKVSHIRLIIGDRHPQGKVYGNHLYDINHTYKLEPRENNRILKEVLIKIPKWELVAQKEFSECIGKTPLFMLLFILAKVNENKKLYGDIDLSEPQMAFIRIIQSDVQFLVNKNCSGLAKALCYWSQIYSQHRILVSYESFLQIVKFLNSKGDRKVKEFANLQMESEITRILKVYIGIKVQNEKYQNQAFHFHHDILSDSGLSQILLAGWSDLDDRILKNMLDVLIEKGDKFSVSSFFRYILLSKPFLFKDQREKQKYISKLLDKGINDFFFFLYKSDLEFMAEKSWIIRDYNIPFWNRIFEEKLLEKDWLNEFLYHKNILDFPVEIILDILSLSEDENQNQNIFTQILTNNKLNELDPALIRMSLWKSKNKEQIQQVCDKLLNYEDFLKLSSDSMCMVISQSSIDSTYLQQICEKVLQYEDVLTLSPTVINLILNKTKNTDTIQKFCDMVLSNQNVFGLQYKIVISAINFSKNDKLVQNICFQVLTSKKIKKISPEIISLSLSKIKNEKLLHEKSSYFINAWETENVPWEVVYQSLYYFSSAKNKSPLIEKIIRGIITDTDIQKQIDIFRIPFLYFDVWEKKAKNIIHNWKKNKNRPLISSVLISYMKVKPREIESICREIMQSWSLIITEDIPQTFLFHYADYLVIALGHPNLKEIAFQVANEIYKAVTERNTLCKSRFLYKTIEKIVIHKEFPEKIDKIKFILYV